MESVFKNDVLKGKVAFVSGGGSGINFGIVRFLGKHGAKIAIMGRRKEVLEKACEQLTSEGIECHYVVGDVRKYDTCVAAVASAVSKFGQIDILVNGAAGNFLCAPEDLSVNGFKTVMEIDTMGTFHMCKAAFEALKATKGAIVNITATLHHRATFYQIHPSAAKAAVDSITRSLALEWGKYGIRTNGIAPGPIKGTEGMSRLSGKSEDRLEGMTTEIPIARLGDVEDIGAAALYLVSPAASYVNGHTIVVDGGARLWTSPFVSAEQYQALSSSRKAKL
eukprot:TRINITY_DN1107_c0_g1_i1.p1 TRINITY_DN1107_c0_g1~~TRINITY_DN1107_c0_g1_i1.p1  ORF type:complete len:279 (+),score=101.28 TRINITY_DN1107_c0_g1_i1:75-911(+)